MNHADLEADVAVAVGLAVLASIAGAVAFLLAVGGALVWKRVH